MKNSINKLALIISTILVSSNAFAFDQTQHDENKRLSSIRTQISQQLLQNQLNEVKLKGLEKQKEMSNLQDVIDGVSTKAITPNVIQQQQPEIDRSLEFNNNITEEDILSKDNNWKQNVGFIYKKDADLNVGNINELVKPSPISALTENENKDQSFEKMLTEIGTSLDKNKGHSDDDEVITEIPKSEFKVTNLELNSLVIFENKKTASIRANYLSNNGFQKIKGARIISVKEGGIYDVKNAYSFKVISINNDGVKVENMKNNKIQFISR